MRQLHSLGATAFHHGDCVGSDQQAHEIAVRLGLWTVAHPPTSSGLRAYCVCDETRSAYPFLVRNRHIAQETSVLIATPDTPERIRSGTWSTVRYARLLSLPLVLILRDGTVESKGVLL